MVGDHGAAQLGQPHDNGLHGRGLTVDTGPSRACGALPITGGGRLLWAVLDAPGTQEARTPSDKVTASSRSLGRAIPRRWLPRRGGHVAPTVDRHSQPRPLRRTARLTWLLDSLIDPNATNHGWSGSTAILSSRVGCSWPAGTHHGWHDQGEAPIQGTRTADVPGARPHLAVSRSRSAGCRAWRRPCDRRLLELAQVTDRSHRRGALVKT